MVCPQLDEGIVTKAQEAALAELRAAQAWKVQHLTTAQDVTGNVLVVRLDRRKSVSRVTNLTIHKDGRVLVTAGPVQATRRKPLMASGESWF